MTDLKLPRLPDRVPVKVTVSVMPDLHRRLQDYASAYAQAYGQDEPISELIPAMLAMFLDADRGFAKARGARGKGAGSDG